MEVVVWLCLLWLVVIAIHANRVVVRLNKLIELVEGQRDEEK